MALLRFHLTVVLPFLLELLEVLLLVTLAEQILLPLARERIRLVGTQLSDVRHLMYFIMHGAPYYVFLSLVVLGMLPHFLIVAGELHLQVLFIIRVQSRYGLAALPNTTGRLAVLTLGIGLAGAHLTAATIMTILQYVQRPDVVFLRLVLLLLSLGFHHSLDFSLVIFIAVHGHLHYLTIPDILEALLRGHALCMLLLLVHLVKSGLFHLLLGQFLLFNFLQRHFILLFDVVLGLVDGTLPDRQIVAECLVRRELLRLIEESLRWLTGLEAHVRVVTQISVMTLVEE